MKPTISVVIPTIERPEDVLRAAADVLDQLPPGGELLVVDQSSPPARERVAEGLAALGDGRARLLMVPARGLPHARNDGLQATRGEVVLFLDDDVRLLPGCLKGHLRAYRRERVGGVVGRIIERRLRPNTWRTANHLGLGGRLRTNLQGVRPLRIGTLKGANMSFRRRALLAAGPFDPNFRGTALLEDADISVRVARLGWELWFEPGAGLVHLSNPSGGVRVPDARGTEGWRFHNTAYFVRKHRGWAGLLPMAATFSAIAARRSAGWRDPGALPFLMRALGEGWRLGGQKWP